MANEQNLEKYNFRNRTTTEQREIAKQGGIASGEARRRKKTLAELGDMIGNLASRSEKNRQIMRDAGIDNEDMVRDTEMMFMLSVKASKGDTNAIALLAKIRGQLKDQVQAEVAEVKPLVDLTGRKKNGED